MNTISSLLKHIGYAIAPIGSVQLYAGATAPNKWLICDGRAVSRTTYALLFAAIGVAYGAGDGSTTFNLPDFRGRTAIGAGTGTATDATAHTLGSIGGEETHTLTIAEMPSHNHSGSTLSWNASNAGTRDAFRSPSDGYTSNTGGGQAHNIMQPYTAINYIIYAGA